MAERGYGEFQVANDYVDDIEALDSIFDRQGYLFFRDVLDTRQVEEVKSDFVRELQKQGFVRPGVSEPIWTGRGVDDLDDGALYGLDYYPKLLDSEKTQAFFRRLFREPVFTFRSCAVRYTMPNDEVYGSPAHQDHFYINHTTDFRTMWLPLMDIDREVGGLAVAEGSHKRGLREHVEQDVYSYGLKGRKQKGVELQEVHEPWLTTSYSPGDIVVFHPHTLHWAPANRSDRVRLSIDVRCQPASSPRSWLSGSTLLEQRQFRTDVQKIATEEGASAELFEALVIEMMARGTRAEQCEVRSLMAQVGAPGDD